MECSRTRTDTRTQRPAGRPPSTTTPAGNTGRRTPPSGSSRRRAAAPAGLPSSHGSSRGCCLREPSPSRAAHVAVPRPDRRRAHETRLEARVGQLGFRVGLGEQVAAEREQRRVLAEHREGPQGPAEPESGLLLPHLREGQGDRLGLVALTPPQPPWARPARAPPPGFFFLVL